VVLPWIHNAFSHVLPPHQLLSLWDGVLGHPKGLYLLAIASAAILIDSSDHLLSCCLVSAPSLTQLKHCLQTHVLPTVHVRELLRRLISNVGERQSTQRDPPRRP
jgi:hypothetical protein